MSRSRAPRLPLRLTAAFTASAFAAAMLAGGCDNPACVFGPGNCQGGGGVINSSEPATQPANHTWLASAAPSVTAFLPNAAGAVHPDTPIVVVFSESMAAATLPGGVLLVDASGLGQPVLTHPPTLIGDGRMMIVIPLDPLTLGNTYELRFNENQVITDLQGSAIPIPTTQVLGSFTVAPTAPATIKVLTSWPPSGSSNQSGTGEIVVIFDRKVSPTNPGTVDNDSFVVTVDGVVPTFNPLPQALVLVGGGAFPVSDTRAWRYRSVDDDGEAVHLGTGGHVEVELSPTGHKIIAAGMGGSTLPPITLEYDIADIASPLSAEIVSLPMDAIGIDNISGPTTLDIAVTLEDGQPGDRLGIFVFGTTKAAQPQLGALFRDVVLNTAGTTVSLGEAELDLADSSGDGRFADGNLTFALQLTRGNVVTPARLLDTDADRPGAQNALFDTVRPTLTGLSTTGTDKVNFRSDIRDFALVGRASERLHSVEVTTALANNGILPKVVGTAGSGLFVAAPVLLGVVDPADLPLPFTAVIYDRALNSATAQINGMFTQVAAVGPGATLPGGPTIDVEVVDAQNLAPLANARVFVHEDFGGVAVVVESGTTGTNGKVQLGAGTIGDTIVTVDLAGFDLFTLHGVRKDRLSVPLTRSSQSPALLAGVVSSASQAITSIDRRVADSRLFPDDEPLIVVQSCTLNTQTVTFDCVYGPRPIRPNLVGVTSFVAAEFPPDELNYNVLSFLRAFALSVPQPVADAGDDAIVNLSVGQMLNDSGVDVEERAIDGPALVLDATATTGLDLGNLDGDPRIEVQALVRGVAGLATVGIGVPFDMGPEQWKVRCAYPGVADGIINSAQDELGELVTDGTIDPDLRVTCELRDDLGARAGRRVRFSTVGATLEPLSPAVIVAPPAGGGSGGNEYNVVFDNSIPDSLNEPGIYRVTLTSLVSGRRWTLYRRDDDDASGATQLVIATDLASLGGAALPNGAIVATVEAFAWPTFDDGLFLWSDLEREQDAFSASAPVTFTQP